MFRPLLLACLTSTFMLAACASDQYNNESYSYPLNRQGYWPYRYPYSYYRYGYPYAYSRYGYPYGYYGYLDHDWDDDDHDDDFHVLLPELWLIWDAMLGRRRDRSCRRRLGRPVRIRRANA